MLNFKELKPLQAMAASLFFRKRRILLSLPRQEGKTELGVRLLHDITRRASTTSSLFLAKDKKAGKKATREKFLRIFDKSDFSVNTENVYLKSHPTSVIFMDSVDKEPDRIRGGTYSMIHWSEVAFSKLEKGVTIPMLFDKIIQPTMRKTNGYVLMESTNNGKNGWYDMWENHKDFGFSRLKVGLSDLVYMGLVTPEEYDEIQRTTHPDVFAQEYECDFISFQGKAYPEFKESEHVEDIPAPKDWQSVVFALDWGYHPSATAVLFAYVENGTIYIFDEHYAHKEMAAITGDHMLAVKHRWNIQRMSGVGDHEEDRIDELNKPMRALNCAKADKANVLGARTQIKELFYFNRIKIHPRCKWLIKDLDSATWDDKKDGEINYAGCTWGHYDAEAALRYLVRAFADLVETEPLVNPNLDSASAAAFDIMSAYNGRR